jgi:hypothetical protein
MKILLLLVLAGTCLAQSIPVEVKQDMVASIQRSNSPTIDDPKGGHHEEGGMWGISTDGKLLIIPVIAGAAHLICSAEPTTLDIGKAINPALQTNLASIQGEWHVHPSGISEDGRCDFVQQPSATDISVAYADTNIVIGARDKIVYFYNSKGVTSKLKLKEFLK